MGNCQDGHGNKCPICGKEDIDIFYTSVNDMWYCYSCSNCGEFFAPHNSIISMNRNPLEQYNTEQLKSYLFYNSTNMRAVLVSAEEYEKHITEEYVEVYNLTPEMVKNWYPKNIYEKIDKILLKIKDLSQFDGDSVTLDYETAVCLFLVDSAKCKDSIDEESIIQLQIKYLIETLLELGYVTINDWIPIKQGLYGNHFLKWYLSKNFLEIILTPKGLAKVYELQKYQANNKKVFIAMSFNPDIGEIYNAIDTAIKEAQCEVVSMKSRIHNKQIVPEMLRLIKESKILVMDISEPNFGAYYEAGYAQGLGREVIFTCKSSVMKKDKFPCDDKKGEECDMLKKYSKPHFDIAQKQILVWEDVADLTEQLTEWIKFLVK